MFDLQEKNRPRNMGEYQTLQRPSPSLQGTSFFNGIRYNPYKWPYIYIWVTGVISPYYPVVAHLVSVEGHPVDGLHRDARDADRPGDWQGEDDGER